MRRFQLWGKSAISKVSSDSLGLSEKIIEPSKTALRVLSFYATLSRLSGRDFGH
jgi:hypothetical protein